MEVLHNLSDQLLHDTAEKLRWFVYPNEAWLNRVNTENPTSINSQSHSLNELLALGCPFVPRQYTSIEENRITQELKKTPIHKDVVVKENTNNMEEKAEKIEKEENGKKVEFIIDKDICPLPKKTTESLYKPIKNKSSTSEKIRQGKKQPPNPQKALKIEKKKNTKAIFSLAVEAIEEFGMIKNGDKVLVGLSGGKDSLTLLHILMQIKQAKKIDFEIGATTVDPQTISYDPSPLIPYLQTLNIPYHYESQGLIERAKEQCPSSICAWCSRMKRGILCQTARKYGYNRLALGQHLDDLAESFLMYAFHNGKLDTMKANSLLKEGDLSIIRPFIYVRELQTKKFAKLNNLPVITENCPACFAEPKERKRMKALLAAQENIFPDLFKQLRTAMHPLMHGRMNAKRELSKLFAQDHSTTPTLSHQPEPTHSTASSEEE